MQKRTKIACLAFPLDVVQLRTKKRNNFFHAKALSVASKFLTKYECLSLIFLCFSSVK